ncbi:MAG: methyltransferase domain-containing protein [Desulfobacterales bacterium]|jgi:2-polyprenyl-3-methyl-5-hydroxy-6-metoxy-1,4-benzoquinol methylase
MAGVWEHYENHLVDYYAWISGGVDLKIEENRKFFVDHNIRSNRSDLAFDLGAGCGFQSIPLAELGFRVVAMDLSAKMLVQLKENAKKLPIKTIRDDLSNFTNYECGNIKLVLCMGDTLTHLESLQKVQELLDKVYSALKVDGCLILSFRNLTVELSGLDRFIPVKSNARTIFTCFLEYEEDTVKVHDIIYEKKDNKWAMKKSFFKKLRISPDWTRNFLHSIGFTIEFDNEEDGMYFIIARKV